MNQIDRIKYMEDIMEKAEAGVKNLSEALENFEHLQKNIKILEDYYESHVWRQDFEADEEGKLPASLKRGVLSQDGVFNLLEDRDELIRQMTRIINKKAAAADDPWDRLYDAALKVQNGRKLSSFTDAGSVSAAVLSREGNIYTGVCIDTACSLGMCAEKNAAANMITNGEKCIDKLLVLMPDQKIGLPCLSCQELLMQLDQENENIEILLDMKEKKTVKLKELFPRWWGSDRFKAFSAVE